MQKDRLLGGLLYFGKPAYPNFDLRSAKPNISLRMNKGAEDRLILKSRKMPNLSDFALDIHKLTMYIYTVILKG
jgi:hypothetical protein